MRLKLNKKEKKHSDLLAAMDETISHLNLVMKDEIAERDASLAMDEYRKATSRLCELTDDILKEEWSRVKNEIRS